MPIYEMKTKTSTSLSLSTRYWPQPMVYHKYMTLTFQPRNSAAQPSSDDEHQWCSIVLQTESRKQVSEQCISTVNLSKVIKQVSAQLTLSNDQKIIKWTTDQKWGVLQLSEFLLTISNLKWFCKKMISQFIYLVINQL